MLPSHAGAGVSIGCRCEGELLRCVGGGAWCGYALEELVGQERVGCGTCGGPWEKADAMSGKDGVKGEQWGLAGEEEEALETGCHLGGSGWVAPGWPLVHVEGGSFSAIRLALGSSWGKDMQRGTR